VVVDHHHVHAELVGGLDLFHGGDAAVRADQEPRAAPRQLAHGLEVEAVAFHQPVRDVELHARGQRRARGAGRELAQRRDQQRGAGDAVHVVVAVDAERLALFQRALHPRHRGVDALQPERVWQLVEPRREEALGRGGVAQAAGPERAAHRGQQPEGGREPRGRLMSFVGGGFPECPAHAGFSSMGV
jgi:hypothetical protein